MSDAYDKLPRKVWVGVHEFTLQAVPRTHPALAPIHGPHPDGGACVFDPMGIFIADNMNQAALLETVWHELTHAVNHACDIEEATEEEDIADKHGKVWTQFWINNPRFSTWWTRNCIAVRKERARA